MTSDTPEPGVTAEPAAPAETPRRERTLYMRESLRKATASLGFDIPLQQFKSWYDSFSNSEKIAFWAAWAGLLIEAVALGNPFSAFIIVGLMFACYLELVAGE